MGIARTCLWFDTQAEVAARFYCDLLSDTEIEHITPGPNNRALMVNMRILGLSYCLMNGGPNYALSPAVSIQVFTKDQAETDRLWDALTHDGAESRCGWCVDPFGLSWQIIPDALPRYVGGSDPDGARRATAAMMTMNKIDIEALRLAYEGS